jgi:protein ImuB
MAARSAEPLTLASVDVDAAEFLAPLPLTLFSGYDRLLSLLAGVGISTCGQFAALEREAIEVRFGTDAVELWQLTRGQDDRRIFSPTVAERLHASTDFVDYVVTDGERLIFVTNALFGSLCDQLRARGEHARRVMLTLSLGNRTTWQRVLKPARPTASRAVWLRLTRALLERLTVPDAVTGVQIEVVATEPATAVQGDLFDLGFATASAVEGAVARLIEMHGNVVVEPSQNQHPLAEMRTVWAQSDSLPTQLTGNLDDPNPGSPELRLQLLEEPREVLVETIERRDHIVPVRFRDNQWRQLVTAAGPDRISGGKWDVSYAREYFRGVTVEGQLVWLFRDARTDKWYVHGYWD